MTERVASDRPPDLPAPTAPDGADPDEVPEPSTGGPLLGPRGCAYRMPNGRSCGGTSRRGVPYCFVHDPASAPEAAEARRLGGLHRRHERVLAVTYDVTGVATTEEQMRLVELGVADILAAPPSLKRGQSLFSAARTSARIRREAETDQRLRRLEEALARPSTAAPAGSLLADAEQLGLRQ
jgi:hypothetical protein